MVQIDFSRLPSVDRDPTVSFARAFRLHPEGEVFEYRARWPADLPVEFSCGSRRSLRPQPLESRDVPASALPRYESLKAELAAHLPKLDAEPAEARQNEGARGRRDGGRNRTGS